MYRRSLRLFTLPCLFIFALLTGCDNIPKDLAGLETDIVGVRSFVRTPEGGAKLIVTVRCRNETVRPIGIREVRIDLAINGLNVGKGTSNRPIATQALSTNTAAIDFIIDDPALADQLAASFDRGTVNYELKTQLMITSGGQKLRSKSSSSGSIDVGNLRR